ncbi:MAG: CBS domain-containing protein [Bacilli bacterium]|jgi:CBS domain-containing protein|nr:CBS domain-containing protein [Bacilli bacterium]MDD3422209.1 CBS domain-containing protein [Bacilli bacterium]MDD4065707.1 CBS domain-containing protein [Bacilli bacterium]
MNVLFFLKPKNEVILVDENATLRQVMEKMEYHRYTSIPIINKKGNYVGTLSEGDILWFIKSKKEFNLEDSEKIQINQIKRYHDNKVVKVDADIDELLEAVKHQNFAPVVDDRNIMIGIVTRQDIIKYLTQHQK